jgi:DNA-binding transcriptional LysR family regulator
MLEKRIKLLRWVSRFGSINKAARELGMSQSSLSREIALLEEQMQAPLLVRTSTGVASTPTGDYLRSFSFGSLTDRIGMQCRRIAAGRLPVLTLECDMVASPLIQPLLTRAAQWAPDMPVQLYCYKTYSLLAHLLAGTSNAAVTLTRHALLRQRLETLPLYRAPWLVAARADHPYWAMSPADRGILQGQTVILDMQQQSDGRVLFSDPVSQYCTDYCLSHRDFLEAGFMQDQIAMLQAGLGVALLPPYAADMLPPEIRLSDELTTPFAPELALVYRSDSHHPGVTLLRTICMELFGGEAHA